MKKILFALVAMLGLAYGYSGSDFNDILAEKLEEAEYDGTTPYTISFRVSETPVSEGYFALDYDYFLINQNHEYWGINTQPNPDMVLNKDWTFRVREDEYVLTSNPGKRLVSWAQTPGGNASGKREVGQFMNVEIKCDGTNTRVRLRYDIDKRVDIFELRDVVLDASKFKAAESMDVSRIRIKLKEPDRKKAGSSAGFVLGGLGALIGFALGFVCGRKGKKKGEPTAAEEAEATEEVEDSEVADDADPAEEAEAPDNK